MAIIQVALPIPKRQVFDYLVQDHDVQPGIRVSVPFGPRKLIGIVTKLLPQSEYASDKLKAIEQVLDENPVLDPELLKMASWISQYYHHPIGEVLQTMLPVALRKGESALPKPVQFLALTEEGKQADEQSLGKARKQKHLLVQLADGAKPRSALREAFSTAVINAVLKKGLIEEELRQPEIQQDWRNALTIGDKPLANVQQSLAISGMVKMLGSFHCALLEGVTGSGKTEVYLQGIEEVLQAGKQVLILVPEIGLTPQTVQRFKRRFGVEVGVLHSNLTDNERLAVWQASRNGDLGIVIGTRSAIFTPMARPGIIIVDEEHDASYKQQDGLRYHARDLAVVRARQLDIPLVLGSATPSLESLNNALQGKYLHFILDDRAGNASHTHQQLLDITNQPLKFGLAPGMISRIDVHLQQGNQVMLFINRRGFAPALLCHQCGHIEDCQRCDKPFTLHKSLNKLQCHHCGSAKPLRKTCSACNSTDIEAQGVGTEQLEQGLKSLFPQFESVRIDSDSARGKTRLHELLDKVNHNQYQLLIGTQILSKGHHFPHVTLVVIVDADGALFSADFRAPEHLAQLITQLAGRAGRAEKPGEMWLQTHQPGHPLLQDLINNGYGHFARFALLERQHAHLPPHTFMALLRAEANDARLPHGFLSEAAGLLRDLPGISLVGPIPALMEKRQGRYRMQLVIHSSQRSQLQRALGQSIGVIEQLQLARKVRWSIDVDPQDFL